MKWVGSASIGILFIWSSVALASGSDMQSCFDMKGNVSAEKQLECYDRVAQENAGKKSTSNSLLRPKGKTLVGEWTPADTPLAAYKQNFFLITQTNQPNNTPSSPNPANNVPFTYELGHREINFQFSFKSSWLLPVESRRHVLWFGYTQNSFWQIFDNLHSRPFRENNYEPELIYSYRWSDTNEPSSPYLKIVNAAFEHQSNGMSDPRSRSWWRFYIQPGFEFPWGSANKVIILPRLWMRIGQSGNPSEDNNPDITHYMGHGDLEIRDNFSGGFPFFVSSIIRSKSLQLDMGFPVNNLIRDFTNVNINFHYFTGYGESLIDYNQNHKTWGVGILLPY